MKTMVKILSLLFVTAILFTACSKDDDPANNDLFVGTYKGSISYRASDGAVISDPDGNVRVVKVGNKYNFLFGSNIPDITGIEFEKNGDNVHVSVGSNENSYIRIDADNLRILYAKDGALWDATCTR